VEEKIKRIIKNYNKIKGEFPKIDWLVKRTGLKHWQVIMILGDLQKQGFLKVVDNRYMYKKKIEKKKEEKRDLSILIIRAVMGAIGIFATFMSVYFSVLWLYEYLEPYLAIILGLSMVLFSVFAFESIIIFYNNKQPFLIVLYSIIWLIVIGFSITSTIGVLHNNQIHDEEIFVEENKEETYKNMEWQMYISQEDELLKLISDKDRELEIVNQILSDFDNLEIREEKENEWLSSLTTKRKAEEKIQNYRDELRKIREDKLLFLEENKQKTGVIEETKIKQEKSFYVMLNKITGIESRYIRFWLYVIPAVFVDLIAPLGLAIALFLRRKEYGKESA
jgi:hypothetical protein